MANKVQLIRLEDGFEGNVSEIANHLGISKGTVYDAVRMERPLIAKKYKYEDLGIKYLRSIYKVVGSDYEGDKVELSKKLFYSIAFIENQIRKGHIVKVRREYRDEPMRI